MKSFITLGLLLSIYPTHHYGSMYTTEARLGAGGGQLWVRGCDKDPNPPFVAIYADKALTVPKPNPFVLDAGGGYSFYTDKADVSILIVIGGKLMTMNTCEVQP